MPPVAFGWLLLTLGACSVEFEPGPIESLPIEYCQGDGLCRGEETCVEYYGDHMCLGPCDEDCLECVEADDPEDGSFCVPLNEGY